MLHCAMPSTTQVIQADASCELLIEGCADSTSLYYLSAATFHTPSRCGPPRLGCTNPFAANFAPHAVADDGSCESLPLHCRNARFLGPTTSCPPHVSGCAESDAANFNVEV